VRQTLCPSLTSSHPCLTACMIAATRSLSSRILARAAWACVGSGLHDRRGQWQHAPVSSKRTWRHWGLAAVVNLGAAVLAALAFGAWQRTQSPQTAAAAHHKRDRFYELFDDVGYIPKANTRMTRAEVEGRTFHHDVVYTTGPDHFRVVPEAAENPDACVLLFGDSFTFGDGVSDDETYAAQIVTRSGGRVAAQNFAVSGWGPHQFLAGLQSGRFQRAVRCRPTDAVFLMVPSLIWRASGVMNSWDTNGPRYRLGADGRPVRDGTLAISIPTTGGGGLGSIRSAKGTPQDLRRRWSWRP
jgi:hypothetical protein